MLDLARVVAHTVNLSAASLTSFLLGCAVGGGQPLAETAAKLQQLAREWQADTGGEPRADQRAAVRTRRVSGERRRVAGLGRLGGRGGQDVTAIFVTHAHGDHFFGAPAVLERFPDARVVAAPGVAARLDAQYGPRFDEVWGPRFPGQISSQHVTAEPLTDGLIELEVEQVRAIELGHTDTDGTGHWVLCRPEAVGGSR